MLTPGNHKLGGHQIWGFALPSGTAAVCVGMTPTCRHHCYAVRTEQYRRRAAARYRRNLALSRRPRFARRVRAFLVAHAVRVVRIHTGGEFYSPGYARTWLAVARRSPRVRFFAYTRAWRVPEVKAVVDELAALPNCQVWYSCDRDTGVPPAVPAGVRVAWLMAAADDAPPAGSDLAFRVRRLRPTPLAVAGGVPVCPAEDGRPRPWPVTCDRCGLCWRPPAGSRLTLPVVPQNPGCGEPHGSPDHPSARCGRGPQRPPAGSDVAPCHQRAGSRSAAAARGDVAKSSIGFDLGQPGDRREEGPCKPTW